MITQRRSRSKYPPGFVLTCEEGYAVVVEPDTALAQALLWIMQEQGIYGTSLTHPALIEASADGTVSRWFAYPKAQREECCDDPDGPWWAPDGRGKRSLLIAFFADVHLDDLELATAPEETP